MSSVVPHLLWMLTLLTEQDSVCHWAIPHFKSCYYYSWSHPSLATTQSLLLLFTSTQGTKQSSGWCICRFDCLLGVKLGLWSCQLRCLILRGCWLSWQNKILFFTGPSFISKVVITPLDSHPSPSITQFSLLLLPPSHQTSSASARENKPIGRQFLWFHW